ncbi:MAG: DNA polymerase III subunit delta [Clostridiales bacterium]|nr:DNA polymerase III subunit delta [Clostridiales bacterium]
MSFKEFGKDLKEGNIKNVCLLWGRESFLSEWAERELIRAYSNDTSRQFDVAEFDGEEADPYKIVEACETLPLFSEKKLVIVDKLPLLESKAGSGGEEVILSYLKNPSDTTILVFVSGEKVDKRKAIYKAIAKGGAVYEFDKLAPSELGAWIKKRFKTHKKNVLDKELKLLIDLSGYYDKESNYTLYHFENDISKVILHSNEDVITSEDIENTVSGNINTNIFTLIDHIGAGDKKSAFNMLSDMFLYGESEYGVLALLHRQYENVLNVKQLLRDGKSKGEIASMLNTKDFIINKWMALGRKYEEEELKNILKHIYNSDKLIKTGEMESRMALELLIASI